MLKSFYHNGFRWKFVGIIQVALSYLIGLVCFVLLVGSFKAQNVLAIIIYIVAGILLSFLHSSGIKSYLKGKKLVVATRPSLSSQDTRRPVVYLRPFKDDISTAKPFGDGPPGSELNYLSFTTEEEQLATVMNELGPFRALGRPGEKLPELGADRTYAHRDTWQEDVRNLLSTAQLVVIRLGMTEWVIWEVSTAVEILKPERLLLRCPGN